MKGEGGKRKQGKRVKEREVRRMLFYEPSFLYCSIKLVLCAKSYLWTKVYRTTGST